MENKTKYSKNLHSIDVRNKRKCDTDNMNQLFYLYTNRIGHGYDKTLECIFNSKDTLIEYIKRELKEFEKNQFYFDYSWHSVFVEKK
jgi:hypothetical protein